MHGALVILGSLLLLVACQAVNFQQTEFIIGGWSEPPADQYIDQTYAQMAAAGFNMVLGGFSSNTTETIMAQLQACARYGIRAIVGGYNIFNSSALPPCNLSSCLGYMLHDEPPNQPPYTMFQQLAEDVKVVRAANPGKLAFINMLPGPDDANYHEYIAAFVKTVNPDILSFDSYPDFSQLPSDITKTGYMETLAVHRNYSLLAGIPFWNFFTTMPWDGVADPTATQVAWQVFTSLAFNAKGVMYFCYWNPYRPDLFFSVGFMNNAIIRADGTPSRHYADAVALNAVLTAWGPTIMQLTSTAPPTLISSDSYPPKYLAGTPVANLTEGFSYLLGVFHHQDGRTGLLLNNWDENVAMQTTVTWAPNGGVTEVSPVTGLDIPVVDDAPILPGLQLSFNAGQGRLFLFA